MKVTIIKNKNGILESVEDKIKSGYEEENRAYTLEFEFPDFLEEYNKIIEFNFDGNKEYDVILENEYVLKNNVTKYSFIPCQIVFTKEEDEHTRVFKTNIFYLDFSESINADIEIDPESEDVKLLNTLIESVNLAVEEVSTLKDEVTLLAEETRLKGEYAQMQGDYAKEQGDSAKEEVDKIETMLEGGELNGATFIPSVSDDGDISWTNDKDLPNPTTKNIKGDTGLTPDISVGSTTTLAPGTNAYVEILGTKENPIINFYIPRGDNGRIEFRLVNQLPVTGEEGIVYLVPEVEPEQGNRYDEYIWINNAWEKFGSASIDIDLDKYYTKEEIATILLDYVTSSSLTQTLANYVTNQGLTTTLLDYVTKTDLTTELADYVKNTDYATDAKAGVIKSRSGFGFSVDSLGRPFSNNYTYSNYGSLYDTSFISKGTLENVITGKGLVSNTDYATYNVAGVIKGNTNAFQVNNSGTPSADVRTYENYNNAGNSIFIGKGTLENVITGKNLETANNKVTTIDENSTDTEYPSAKAVYNSIKDFSTEEELLSENPTENVEGTELEIDNTIDSRIKLNKLGGNTSQEGTPTPDIPQEVKVVTGENVVSVSGKNLLDTSMYSLGSINGNTGQNEEGSIVYRFDKYNEVKPNTTIYLLKHLCIYFYNENKGFISSNIAGNLTITTPPNTKYIRFRIFGADFSTFNPNDYMVSYTQETHFVPYSKTDYPINLGNLELCKIGDYKDYLYKNNGKWYVHKEIGKTIYNGAEEWNSYNNQAGNFTVRVRNTSIKSGTSTAMLCNYFKNTLNGANANKGEFSNTTQYYNLNFVPTDDLNITNVAEWKTWLSTHNVAVYYPLATPTEEEITNSTLIYQLEDFYNAKTLQEKTIISQENEELPFILNLDYFTNSIAGNIAGTNYNVDTLIADIEKALEEINGESVGG